MGEKEGREEGDREKGKGVKVYCVYRCKPCISNSHANCVWCLV